jgi:hypothetical protein
MRSFCLRERHVECPHAIGVGGGFNPSGLLPGLVFGLCACDCHALCPVSGGPRQLAAGIAAVIVSAQAWRDSCTCLGAEAGRAEWAPSFDEMRAKARQDRTARREAFAAAKAQAARKCRDEIRELYVAELRARGLKIPAPEALEAIVAGIMGNPVPGVRMAIQSVSDLIGFVCGP